ncbi:alpha-amylase family glycosyl hydrolase [Chondromyces apiculatus]|uniref:Alpha-amylase n=1 Tax=Chondromyces apiculatus DSM 436 TaxID=1192034 RepID=A0A017TEP4_9BACT|nr:alpha-amylase family glycosyl hydrolase [Chondromyces apiculatus]EYF07714.1 alpha-amylase [Chondromyces apiculatus DSM 436]
MRTSLSPLTALALVGGLLGMSLAAACNDDTLLDRYPPGTGAFDPGTIPPGSGSGSGYGAGGPGTGAGEPGTGGGGGIIDPGPPQCDDEFKRCTHEFTYQGTGNETSVEVRGSYTPGGWDVGVPMTNQGGVWTATVTVPYEQQVQYKLVIDGSNWIADPDNPEQVSDGFGGYNSLLLPVTCDPWTCQELPGTFNWRDAVLYFVFVDRFLDGNPANNGSNPSNVQDAARYQGGDWAGVRQKIADGYFTELGVNVLWLTVPMDNTELAGQGNSEPYFYTAYHGYWPKDLTKTEERFGTLQEFQQLVEEAHAAGLKVIVDYAMNHVHSSSPVYQQNPGWFWANANDNGGNCICGDGCSWDGDPGKKCWFTSYLPDFNFTVQAARDWSVENAVGWIQQTGIDGYRLDAVKHIEDQWILDLRARVTSEIESATGEHFYMVGETFTGDRGVIGHYVDSYSMLDGQFDFPLRASIVRTILMRQGSMNELVNEMNISDGAFSNGIMSTFIGNHDVPRSIHFAQDTPLWNDNWAGGRERGWENQPGLPGGLSAFERLANGFTLIYTTKGVPLMYYGDEVGLAGAGDPDNRRFMQWSGYSAGQTKLLNHVKKLGSIRAAHPALRRGTRQTLTVTADTLAYAMTGGGETVYVAINRSDAATQVGGLPSGAFTDLLTSATVNGPSVSVPARSALILAP